MTRTKSKTEKNWIREARIWIEDEGLSEFSFVWVCHQLEIDPKVIRDKLKEWVSGTNLHELSLLK